MSPSIRDDRRWGTTEDNQNIQQRISYNLKRLDIQESVLDISLIDRGKQLQSTDQSESGF